VTGTTRAVRPASTPAEHDSLSNYLMDRLAEDERRHIALISFNQWTFAVGAVIETALAARGLGSEVTVALWADDTPLRDPGWRASRRIARLLGSRTRDQNAHRALLAAGLPAACFARPPLRGINRSELPTLPEDLTRASIRTLTYRGSPMGRSILQVHPDDQTPIRDDHRWPRAYLRQAVRSYAWAYDQAQALIRRRGITTVVVYNGRFTHDRAVAAAARDLGARVLYYDTGGYQTDYDLTTATTHDWEDLQRRMIDMYDRWDPVERDELGSRWFIDRMTHADTHNRLFTGIQTPGFLAELPAVDHLVVFFSSSGDEIVELDLDWTQFLTSQENALSLLANAVRRRPNTALVVRTHPHMRLKPRQDLQDWLSAVERAQPDLHIDPSSSVDSYALMRQADVVFTYGSTSGVEAAFLGRPVAVMGPSAYDLLGCALPVRSADEIDAVLAEPPQAQPIKAIPYGLMMQRRGFAFDRIQGHGEQAVLAGVPLAEASDVVLRISDALQRRRISRLIRR